MRTINCINYNWFFSTNESSTGFESRQVGILYGNVRCVNIEEHPAAGEGDKWYYDIYYSDGNKVRVFNPNEVFFNSDDEL